MRVCGCVVCRRMGCERAEGGKKDRDPALAAADELMSSRLTCLLACRGLWSRTVTAVPNRTTPVLLYTTRRPYKCSI
jgi:hypothetical protein